MKPSVFHARLALVTCIGLIAMSASAAPWWKSPMIKSSEDTGVGPGTDPHYMSKDKNDQYLFVPLASANPSIPGKLYSIPALISGVSSNDITPITSGTPNDLYGNWKGGAVSSDLKRIITGNGVPLSVTVNASLPLTAPWLKDETVFAITNQPSEWGMDGIDFSQNSEFLFSNVYNSGYRNLLVTWNVIDLNGAGLALTTNTLFTSSLSRIRNVSASYINGQDLVYYGEGDDALGISPRKVCVYDPSLGTETVLVTLNRSGEAGVVSTDLDIMNVKVGGVGLGTMHLYIQCNDGALYIYTLNADGKAVGTLERSFSVAEMKELLGVGASGNLGNADRIRCLEFTNDEKFAFFVHAPSSGSALLHTIWTPPKEVAWWVHPSVKLKADASTSGPHYLNKDESDQYLFLCGVPGGTGYLYSIPALIAADTSSEVAPIAQSPSMHGVWKCAALSDDLLRIVTGSGATDPAYIMENASLPLSAPWTQGTTVYAITNDPPTLQFDGADFSHTSQHLYSNTYTTPRNRIVQWNVGNLLTGGIGLTTNKVFTTSLSRIRNVSSYFIEGQDLIYYGEGAYSANAAKVCVLNPASGIETVLTDLKKQVASDIMNVKVGGVGLGKMHLYVQCDNGTILVFELAPDGLALGTLVCSFSRAQTQALFGGANFPYMRSFEITNDEKFAFFSYHYANGLFVVWTDPSFKRGTVILME